MIGFGMIWAMLSVRTILVLVGIALALYGRSGVLQSRQARAILPWLTPARRSRQGPDSTEPSNPPAAPRPGPAAKLGLGGDRMFWFFTILAASALAAWIVTRTLIVSDSALTR